MKIAPLKIRSTAGHPPGLVGIHKVLNPFAR